MPRGPATCVSVTGEARPHLSLLADAITAGEAQERNGERLCFFYMHGMHAARGHSPAPFKKLLLSVRLASHITYNILHITYKRHASPERRCSSRTFRYGYLVTT